MSSNTRCSDLNPIENVWDALERQVSGRNYPPTNKNTLIRALTEEWDKLPQQLLDNVVQTVEKNNSTRPLNSKIKANAGEKQLNSSVGTKQLNSAAGMKQLNSALPSTTYNRLHRLYSRIGFFYLLRWFFE
ncbi:hypothetical protein TNCV_3890041 [Trichonephila clavipes]|nr:hypothetical protein TNCV_3890041 [Trichonephila clavipes]